MRPGWDEYFIGIAEAVSKRSDCTRRSVGAVIVDGNRRITGTGYNGSLPGSPSCSDGACPRGKLSLEEFPPGKAYGNCIAIHAEQNAILHSDRSKHEGGTIYITCPPCDWCLKVIWASGIKRIVWPEGEVNAKGSEDMLLQGLYH
jgi:dCMP deaminase